MRMGRLFVGSKGYDVTRVDIRDREVIVENKGQKETISLMTKTGNIKNTRIEINSSMINTIKTNIPVSIFGAVDDLVVMGSLEVDGVIESTKSEYTTTSYLDIRTYEQERRDIKLKGQRLEKSPIVIKASGIIEYIGIEIEEKSKFRCYVSGDIHSVIARDDVKFKGTAKKVSAASGIVLAGQVVNVG